LWVKAGHEVMFADRDPEPGARIARAFSAAGAAQLQREAHRAAPRIAIALAADDATALKTAMQPVEDAGFEPVAWARSRAPRRSIQAARYLGAA